MEEQKNWEESTTLNADPADVEKHKTMAILAYFIFFLPLVTDAKDSPFAMFHANQSLVLMIFSFGAYFFSGALAFVTFNLFGFIVPIVLIAIFVFWIIGIVNASNGEMKELPLIGGVHILDE